MRALLAFALLALATPALAAPPAPSFTVDDVSADEQGGSVEVTVRKHGRLNKSPSTVTFRTLDGTAKATADYAATTMTLTFGADETVKKVAIPLVKDQTVEANETFSARIAAGSNARLYDGTAVVTITDSYAPQPPPAPTPPAPPATEFPAAGTIVAVASGVDVAANLYGPIDVPPVNQSEDVGAFRFWCGASHVSYDDPIIMPGKPGQFHHLHQFFGNTGANANSTYEGLRKDGDSTCVNALNRSAYWMPALTGKDTSGNAIVVVPSGINIYYKRRPKAHPELVSRGLTAADLPLGLRMVFGFPDYPPWFKCTSGDFGVDKTGGWIGSMDVALSKCTTGDYLLVSTATGECWDGKNLDSADHRSHVKHTFVNSWEGFWRCPETHKVMLPQFTLQAAYRILPTDLTATWVFDSDAHLNPTGPRGSSFHADWFGAWEESIADLWQEWCINRKSSCASGNLGNGWMMRESEAHKATLWQDRRLPVPPRG